MMELHSRFPPPWSIGDDGGCFIVRAGNGQAVAYIYYFDEDQGNSAGKLLSRDEAEEIAAKIARLPDLP